MRRILTSLLIISLAACGGTDDSDALDADENTAVSSNEGALTAELTDDEDAATATTSEQVAAAAATRVGSHLSPAGCLTTTVTANTVSYVFDHCTGPRGLLTLTGTVNGVYTLTAPNQVHAVLTSTGFQVNQTTLNLNATIDAVKQGTVKRAEISSQTTGTGPRGNTVSRAGDYTVSWDSATSCFTLDGTTGSSRLTSTTVTDYQRCDAKCPVSGTVVHTGPRGNTITLVYDGSASAQWSTSGGRSGTLTLKCTAN